jgi:hypothetical protein
LNRPPSSGIGAADASRALVLSRLSQALVETTYRYLLEERLR